MNTRRQRPKQKRHRSLPLQNRLPTTKSRASGFTLIEVVASAVLSSILMAALLGVVWSAVRESSRQRDQKVSKWPTTQLVNQLRRDFQNARGIATTERGVLLRGILDGQRKNEEPTMLPGEVRYERVILNRRGVLIRHRSGASGSDTEPIWIGVDRIIVEPLEELNSEDNGQADPLAGGLPPVPGALRVTLVSDRGKYLWREVIRHHAN